MSSINIINYESFALDYLEGELAGETLREMEGFLAKHPAVRAELAGMAMYHLEPEEDILFLGKEELLHPVAPSKGGWIGWKALSVLLFLGIILWWLAPFRTGADNKRSVKQEVSTGNWKEHGTATPHSPMPDETLPLTSSVPERDTSNHTAEANQNGAAAEIPTIRQTNDGKHSGVSQNNTPNGNNNNALAPSPPHTAPTNTDSPVSPQGGTPASWPVPFTGNDGHSPSLEEPKAPAIPAPIPEKLAPPTEKPKTYAFQKAMPMESIAATAGASVAATPKKLRALPQGAIIPIPKHRRLKRAGFGPGDDISFAGLRKIFTPESIRD